MEQSKRTDNQQHLTCAYLINMMILPPVISSAPATTRRLTGPLRKLMSFTPTLAKMAVSAPVSKFGAKLS